MKIEANVIRLRTILLYFLVPFTAFVFPGFSVTLGDSQGRNADYVMNAPFIAMAVVFTMDIAEIS